MLHTDRLELRPLLARDGDELHALFLDAGVRRWLLDDQLMPREWVEDEIDASASRFAAGSCGLWALREGGKADERTSLAESAAGDAPPAAPIVGFAGFRPFWEPPELELLYGLHPSCWGRGYATEAAEAALAHAFTALGFDEARAATDVPNVASIAVLMRLGFQEWMRTEHGPQGTVRFKLPVARWRERLTSLR